MSSEKKCLARFNKRLTELRNRALSNASKLNKAVKQFNAGKMTHKGLNLAKRRHRKERIRITKQVKKVKL